MKPPLKSVWFVYIFIGVGALLVLVGGILLLSRTPTPPSPNPPPSTTSPSAQSLPGLVPTAPGTTKPSLITDVTSALPQTPVFPTPFQRAGFGIAIPARADLWASRLGAGWYLDWTAGLVAGSSPEHWKMIRVTSESYEPSLESIRQLAQRDPGSVWILGNEPDVIWQDNLPPEAYAEAYHELYTAIKAADPGAAIAVAGVSQATPLRLAYLDRVLEAYQALYGENLPADWWTVHGFVLQEKRNSWGVEIPPGFDVEHGMLYEISDHGRLDFFEKQLRDFRSWLARRGYRETPLALTEFGILMPVEYGFPPEFVAQYLKDTFALLHNMRDSQTGYPSDEFRLVQRWAWFSLTDPKFPASNLANLANDRLTLVGEAYSEFIISLSQP